VNLAVRIGQIVAAFFKDYYQRPRPSYVCPGLLPPFGPPSHASFPSGHSLQSWLLTGLLSKVAPAYGFGLSWLAERVALNRERVGLHYPSDTRAGQIIADECIKLIDAHCPKIADLITKATAEWP
jgi:membrane-associated phospholipid phosphatase